MNSIALKKVLKHVKVDLRLSRAEIDKQMCRQSGLYMHYAMAYALALRDEKQSRLRLEMLETKIYRALSVHHSRVTERMTLAECHINKVWLKLFQFTEDHAQSVDVLKGVVQALMHKKDMLVNLGATVREEMKGDTSISKPR